jgi:hypothetical protein
LLHSVGTAGQTVRTGTSNIPDEIGTERAATAKAQDLITEYGWNFRLANKSREAANAYLRKK